MTVYFLTLKSLLDVLVIQLEYLDQNARNKSVSSSARTAAVNRLRLPNAWLLNVQCGSVIFGCTR